jgi:hypothetical protein
VDATGDEAVHRFRGRPRKGSCVRYEIRVEGHLSEPLARAFPELGHVVMAGQTVLFGPVEDAAHLYGLLARCQSLGLRVVEIRQLPE